MCLQYSQNKKCVWYHISMCEKKYFYVLGMRVCVCVFKANKWASMLDLKNEVLCVV